MLFVLIGFAIAVLLVVVFALLTMESNRAPKTRLKITLPEDIARKKPAAPERLKSKARGVA